MPEIYKQSTTIAVSLSLNTGSDASAIITIEVVVEEVPPLNNLSIKYQLLSAYFVTKKILPEIYEQKTTIAVSLSVNTGSDFVTTSFYLEFIH